MRYITDKVHQAYELKVQHEDPDVLEELERYIILSAIDRLWQEHLYVMDGVRDAIGMRQYAQKDPLVEYKTEAYSVFVELMDNINNEVLGSLFRTTTRPEEYEAFLQNLPQQLSHDTDILEDFGGGQAAAKKGGASNANNADANDREDDSNQVQIKLPIKRELPKVGRNEPCSCGSGKKFKQCCGRKA